MFRLSALSQPNSNTGFAFNTSPLLLEHFIIGDFIVVDVINSDIDFDERMSLKEDYDFTCQHLHKHGIVCRVNRIFMTAEHYTNAGGAVAVRTARRERKNIGVLRQKWPGVFLNQRRENEVILSWKSRDISLGGNRVAPKVDSVVSDGDTDEELECPPPAPMAVNVPVPMGNLSLPKGSRCGKCEACSKPDCDRCKHCLDKVRNGGSGRLKQSCMHKMPCMKKILHAQDAVHCSRKRRLNRCARCESCLLPECNECRACVANREAGSRGLRQCCSLRQPCMQSTQLPLLEKEAEENQERLSKKHQRLSPPDENVQTPLPRPLLQLLRCCEAGAPPDESSWHTDLGWN
jgi:hypothetical protein